MQLLITRSLDNLDFLADFRKILLPNLLSTWEARSMTSDLSYSPKLLAQERSSKCYNTILVISQIWVTCSQSTCTIWDSSLGLNMCFTCKHMFETDRLSFVLLVTLLLVVQTDKALADSRNSPYRRKSWLPQISNWLWPLRRIYDVHIQQISMQNANRHIAVKYYSFGDIATFSHAWTEWTFYRNYIYLRTSLRILTRA